MTIETENAIIQLQRKDRTLFSSLLKHIVQAAPNEDPSDFVLASIGRNVGADRCYVYRFWEPGKTSMCTNTHEWCAEGIKPEIGGQQACDLSALVEFNAHITSGRDFLFTDINTIDAGSREWLEPQGIKSLIATPLVGANNTICGFAGFDFVKAPCGEITERIIVNIHEAADLLLNCQRLHEKDVALLDVSRRESEHEENEREFERALITLQKDARTMHTKQMLEIVRNRLDADMCLLVQEMPSKGGGKVLPEHAVSRNGWTNKKGWTIDPTLCRALDTRLKTSAIITLRESEIGWLKAQTEGASTSDFSDNLKIVHSIGIRQEGRLAGVLCVGYEDERSLTPLLTGFLRRSALVIVSTLERIATYHDLNAALDQAHLKGDIVEFMFQHTDYAEVRNFIGEKVREITGAQHLLLCSNDGERTDWFSDDAPTCCHNCVEYVRNFGRNLPPTLFSEDEIAIIQEGEELPKMNQPHYCPMKSVVLSQFKRDGGWWRLVADYTKSHERDLPEVARIMRMALELVAIAYDREKREETIKILQEHQSFRADTLAYALSKDDLPGLINLTMHRLLELTACDYIAIHTVDGDHRMLHPGGELAKCPHRCTACSFYKLKVPSIGDSDNIIELDDTKGQCEVQIPSECPAMSLEVVVVYCEGKPWGGIALHYLEKQRQVSADDRDTLKIAADVLTLALERHSSAVRLEQERDRVVEAEKARSYFFSSVSHDIRTPLNAIIGFSELLQSGDVPPAEAKQDLKMIVASGKTLLQLVNDVLDLSKMDLGKLEFSFEPTDVKEVVQEIVPVFRPLTVAKRQTIVVDVSDMPRLMVDAHRFRQVLFNFVSNAVKYAGQCTIRVSASFENGILKLTVADNGKGVSPEKAKRLMQPFVQADIKNRTEGSGLGLAICKRLVEIAHGKISIDTAPGKGFAIHTEVPTTIAPESEKGEKAATAAAIKAPSASMRVLVVDDSPVNRSVLKAMMKKLGITNVGLAEDGKAALEKLERDPDYDIVLSDMWMPVMDGTELIRRIRADKRLAGLKVCSITADVEARANYKELGFDTILLKPVTLEKLSELFSKMGGAAKPQGQNA